MAIHDSLWGLLGRGGWDGLTLGRWMQPVWCNLARLILGTYNITTPEFYGFIVFFSLAVMICIFADMFMLENRFILAALCGFAAVSPNVMMLFGYMDFIPHYFLGVFCAVSAGYILGVKAHSVKNFLLGTFLLCLATAEYQCFFPITMSILLLIMINRTEKISGQKKYETWKDYWSDAVYYVGCGIAALVLYVIINKFVMFSANFGIRLYSEYVYIPEVTMRDYAGLRSWGMTGITEYLERIVWAYKFFFLMPQDSLPVFMAGARNLYYIILIISIYLVCREFLYLHKTSTSSAYQFLISVIILPLCINLINIIAGPESYSPLHALTWIIAVVFILQRVEVIPAKRFLRNAVIILFIISNFITAENDNALYVKLDLCQTQAISWFTTMVTRIKSVPGYKDDYPVAYINEYEKNDASIPYFYKLDRLPKIYPYNMADLVSIYDRKAIIKTPRTPHYGQLINNYAWKLFVQTWCGYIPELVEKEDAEALAQTPEVQAMPSYPDDGSIKVINGVVIVKF